MTFEVPSNPSLSMIFGDLLISINAGSRMRARDVALEQLYWSCNTHSCSEVRITATLMPRRNLNIPETPKKNPKITTHSRAKKANGSAFPAEDSDFT